jgi:NAD(P)-dependent dehydrogenase (short-subunit alcohol dehydrogenase family)
MIPVRCFEGQTVAVFGLARSGLASARALVAGGARVAAWDERPGAREVAAAEGLELVDLSGADWSEFAALVLSPGVPLYFPEPHWTVRMAEAAGVEVIGDIELFARAALEMLGGVADPQLPLALARLTKPFRHKPGLTRVLPAHVRGTMVTPVDWQGSGDVASLCRANAYLVADPDRAEYLEGDTIPVLLR